MHEDLELGSAQSGGPDAGAFVAELTEEGLHGRVVVEAELLMICQDGLDLASLERVCRSVLEKGDQLVNDIGFQNILLFKLSQLAWKQLMDAQLLKCLQRL